MTDRLYGKELIKTVKTFKACGMDIPLTLEPRAVDRAHICILEARAMPHYCDAGPMGIAVDMKDCTGLAEPESILKFKLDADCEYTASLEGPKYILEADDATYRVKTKAFEGNPRLHPFEWDVSIEGLDVQALAKVLARANGIANHIIFTMGPGDDRLGYAFYDKASPEDGAEGTIPTVRDGRVRFDANEPVRSLFPIDYLKRVIAEVDKKDRLTMHLGTDYPLKLTWADGMQEFDYYLAPRIEAD